jgi:hypothetical protein
MKKMIFIILIAIAVTLAGCQKAETITSMPKDSQRITATSQSMSTQASETTEAALSKSTTASSSVIPQMTAHPSQPVTETASPTPPIPPEVSLQFQCINAEPSLSNESNGTVIMENRAVVDGRYKPGDFILDMATGELASMNKENESGSNFSVSPDRKFMAYHNIIFDDADQVLREELVIASANGNTMDTIPWENGWYAIAGWLDTQRLAINFASQDPKESHALKAASLLVLNPFTRKQQILRPDFPDIYNYAPIPDWDFWGITLYNPTLTRLVYLRVNENGVYEYAFWDIQKEQLLTSLTYDSQIPRWSPDGSYVVLDGLPSGQNYIPGGKNTFETFLIGSDGKVEQLTYLNTYLNMYLLRYSWSPDGRYIAAWLGSSTMEKKKEAELVILDTDTKNITNYCLRVKYGQEIYGEAPPAPIWSPDGNQLIVQDLYADYHRRVFLVAIAQGFSKKIAEDMEPFGWMLAPQP